MGVLDTNDTITAEDVSGGEVPVTEQAETTTQPRIDPDSQPTGECDTDHGKTPCVEYQLFAEDEVKDIPLDDNVHQETPAIDDQPEFAPLIRSNKTLPVEIIYDEEALTQPLLSKPDNEQEGFFKKYKVLYFFFLALLAMTGTVISVAAKKDFDEEEEIHNSKDYRTTPPSNLTAYFCGRNFAEASECLNPCPSGTSDDCPLDQACFEHVFNCLTMPPATLSPTLSPTVIPSLFPTMEPSLSPTIEPTSRPTPTFYSYCGKSFWDATTCDTPCPSGNNADCPNGELCFTHVFLCQNLTDAPTTMPTNEPTSGPTHSFYSYCGKSFWDAATCDTPCPSGNEADCPNGELCFTHVFSCHNMTDSPTSLPPTTMPTSFPTVESTTLPTLFPTVEPTLSSTNEPTSRPTRTFYSYCGSSFWDAATCDTPCSSGNDADCPNDELCFTHVFSCHNMTDSPTSLPPTTMPTLFPTMEHTTMPTLFPTIEPTLSSTNEPTSGPTPTFYSYCGNSFWDAATCDTPCPSGNNADCPNGELCFTHVFSCNNITESPSSQSLPPSEVPSVSPTKESHFCGKTLSEAASCLIPCPSGLNSDCLGLTFCFHIPFPCHTFPPTISAAPTITVMPTAVNATSRPTSIFIPNITNPIFSLALTD